MHQAKRTKKKLGALQKPLADLPFLGGFGREEENETDKDAAQSAESCVSARCVSYTAQLPTSLGHLLLIAGAVFLRNASVFSLCGVLFKNISAGPQSRRARLPSRRHLKLQRLTALTLQIVDYSYYFVGPGQILGPNSAVFLANTPFNFSYPSHYTERHASRPGGRQRSDGLEQADQALYNCLLNTLVNYPVSGGDLGLISTSMTRR